MASRTSQNTPSVSALRSSPGPRGGRRNRPTPRLPVRCARAATNVHQRDAPTSKGAQVVGPAARWVIGDNGHVGRLVESSDAFGPSNPRRFGGRSRSSGDQRTHRYRSCLATPKCRTNFSGRDLTAPTEPVNDFFRAIFSGPILRRATIAATDTTEGSPPRRKKAAGRRSPPAAPRDAVC